MKRAIRILPLLLLTFLFCACGANVRTRLEVADDLSGVRSIVCVIGTDTLEEKFSGGAERLERLLDEECPPQLSCRTYEEEETYFVEFSLPFDSLADYRSKASGLLGREASIQFSLPDSVFAKGIAVSEDFESRDLLAWLKKAIARDELVSDLSNLWEAGETKLVFGGEEFSSGARISVNRIEYAPLERIEIHTDARADGGFDRQLSFVIPSSTYEPRREAIEELFAGMVPEGAQTLWEPYEEGMIYRVSYSAAGTDALNAATQTALGFDGGGMRLADVRGDNPLVSYARLYETLDLSLFGSDANGRVHTVYTFQPPPGSGFQGAAPGEPFALNRFEAGLTADATLERSYRVAAMEAETRLLEEARLEKTLTLRYAPGEPETAAELAALYFTDNAAVDAEVVRDDAGPQCVVTFSGTQGQINEALENALGDRNSVLYTAEKSGIARIDTALDETVNLRGLMRLSGYEGGAVYRLAASPGEKLRSVLVDGEKAGEEKPVRSVELRLEDGTGRIRCVGRITPVSGVLLLILLWVLGIAAAGAAFAGLCRLLAVRGGAGSLPFGEQVRVALRMIAVFLYDLGDAFLPGDVRRKAYRYFFGSKWPLWLAVAALVSVPLTLRIPRRPAWVLLTPLLILLAAGLLHAWERLRTNPEAEKRLDRLIEEDLQGFQARAAEKLGLTGEQAGFTPPLLLTGPGIEPDPPPPERRRLRRLARRIGRSVRDQVLYRPRLAMKQGADGKTRYSVVKAYVFLFGESQLFAYEASYDLCTGKLFAESTAEFFYQDIDSIAAEETAALYWDRRGRPAERRYAGFRIVSRSGTSQRVLTHGGADALQEQILAMRHLARDKKHRAAAL